MSRNSIRRVALGIIATSVIALAGISVNVAAQEDDSENRGQGKRRGPPPEALEACANLSEGEACAFTGRRGDMTGICFAPPKEDAALACAPEGGPPKHRERDEAMEQIED
ncbi:hypothetical protein R0137_00370 [Congregibacter brevis]|uniref:Hemolysin n=1 Tax=Congregibacter brevis TaxID=3081201 RepID=A0ABZ0IBZ1_9GAMM|nr:hypothetical protein R0137_00370 [Congregibacter sp. IMCC45268]